MQPLDGIRVLDFTHALAGSACTNCLQRLGAEVIKIERPEVGDDLRHYTEHEGMTAMSLPFCSANAGKKSVTVDLKNPKSKEIIRRLAETSHIVVENYRPGVPEKLGVDWPSIQKMNPKIVYCTVTGFGQTGPLRDWTAYDHIVQAMSGIMWVNGEPDRGPLKVGMPAVDTFSGYVAAIGVLAALRRAEATGKGEFIDVAMLDAALTLMSSTIASHLYNGQMPKRLGNQGYRLVPTAGMFPTKDGHITIGANHQHQVERMFRVIGREDLLDDERFATHKSRKENGPAVHEQLRQIFSEYHAEELEKILTDVQIPASMVRSIKESTRHPHVEQRRVIVNAPVSGQDKKIRLLRGAPRLEDSPDEIGAVPRLGEHTNEVLTDLGFNASEIESLYESEAVWREDA